MYNLSREMMNIVVQLLQRMRNERSDAPGVTEPDLVEQLLAYADSSADEEVKQLAASLREKLPKPESDPDPEAASARSPTMSRNRRRKNRDRIRNSGEVTIFAPYQQFS